MGVGFDSACDNEAGDNTDEQACDVESDGEHGRFPFLIESLIAFPDFRLL